MFIEESGREPDCPVCQHSGGCEHQVAVLDLSFASCEGGALLDVYPDFLSDVRSELFAGMRRKRRVSNERLDQIQPLGLLLLDPDGGSELESPDDLYLDDDVLLRMLCEAFIDAGAEEPSGSIVSGNLPGHSSAMRLFYAPDPEEVVGTATTLILKAIRKAACGGHGSHEGFRIGNGFSTVQHSKTGVEIMTESENGEEVLLVNWSANPSVSGWERIVKIDEGFMVETDEYSPLGGPYESLDEALSQHAILRLSSAVVTVSSSELSAEEIRERVEFDDSVRPGNLFEINGTVWQPDERTISEKHWAPPAPPPRPMDLLSVIQAFLNRARELSHNWEESGFKGMQKSAGNAKRFQSSMLRISELARAKTRADVERVLRREDGSDPHAGSFEAEILARIEAGGWEDLREYLFRDW